MVRVYNNFCCKIERGRTPVDLPDLLLKDKQIKTVKAFVSYLYAYPQAVEALGTFLTDKRSSLSQ